MKLHYYLPILLGFTTVNAQNNNYEQEVADKACECISNITEELNSDNYLACITDTMTKEIPENSDIANQLSTVEGVNAYVLRIDEILTSECDALKNPNDIKKEKFYADSENETAQSYFTTSTDMLIDGNYEAAIEGFLISVKHDPNFVKAYDHLAICYRRLEDFDNAVKYYKKSLEIFPEGDLALANIGLVYRLMEEYELSIKSYSQLVDLYPNNPEGYYGLGQVNWILEDVESALDYMFKAYIIYTNTGSDYTEDAIQIINALHETLIDEGKEERFFEIAKQNDINIE